MSDLLLMASSPLRYLQSIPGTVALYDPWRDVYGRNVMREGSEVIVEGPLWEARDGANLTITGGQPDSNGGTSAYRVQSSGGTATAKMRSTSIGDLGGINDMTSGVWVKVNSGSVRVANYLSTGTAYQDVVTTDGWTRVSLYSPIMTSHRYIAFHAPAVDQNLDITIFQPQINLGSTLYPYSAPVGFSQSVVDRSGNGNHAQLGSTAGADTNDPSWGDAWLQHTDDDGVDGGAMPFQRESSWSALFCFRPSGGGVGQFGTLLNFSSRTSDNEHCRITYNSDNSLLRVNIRRSDLANDFSNNITGVTDTSKWYAGILERKAYASGGTLRYINPATGVALATVTADAAFSAGAANLSVGYLHRVSVGSYVNSMYWGWLSVLNRTMTTGEMARAYFSLKSLMASRGVTVA